MRVLQIHTRYRQAGGEDTVVRAEAQLLEDAGHEVIRYWFENPTGRWKSLAATARAPWNTSAAKSVGSVVDKVAPDVVHIHNTWFALSTSVFATVRDRQIPLVATLHNYRFACVNGLFYRDGGTCLDCLGRSPVPGIVHRCYRDSVALSGIAALGSIAARTKGVWSEAVDRFLVPSAAAANLLIAGGVRPERVVIKPHFTADPGPRVAPPSRSSAVIFVGRLVPEKGLVSLLRAWAQLPPGKFELHIIGEGPLRPAPGASTPAGVSYLGWLPPAEVRRRLLAARALVIPSEWPEPFGLAALEAMACGLPVIASNVGALPAVTSPAYPDLLVAPGDTAALASALNLLHDRNLVDGAGRASRSRYEEAFTPELNLPQLEAAYVDAIAGRENVPRDHERRN